MPPPPGASQPHVFLSYASVDRERALAVADALEAAGIRVWIDRRGIAGGAMWIEEIARAVREAPAVLVLCSAASVNSRNVRQELQLAWDQEKPILPLLLEPVDFPDAIAYVLQGRQWIDLANRKSSDWIPEVRKALEPRAKVMPGKHQEFAQLPELAHRQAVIQLPAPPNDLLGREQEVAAIAAMLVKERLVTLTGPGGTGKTRLAIEVGWRLASESGLSVWFVDLAPIREPDLVLPAIVRSVGVQDTDGSRLRSTLKTALERGRSLLLLDNFEHLTVGAPLIADMLVDIPSLRVVVTSRERLRLRAEVEFAVGSLAGDAAVELFVARASAIGSQFAMTPAATATVREICRRLDDLPLAIELAAARAKLLSPNALLSRLASRLPLLTGGARDLPDRQRTLRNAIAWSYDLLSESERRLFRQLAIFSGGWTTDAAEAVCGWNGEVDVLEGLASLLDKSLIRQVTGRSAEPRLSMLETVREFALEQLTAARETETLRAAHAAWYVELATTAGPEFDAGSNVEAWLARLDVELPNLRAALTWFQEAGDGTSMLKLVGNTDELWSVRPYLGEARRWLEAGLTLAPNTPDDTRARALHVLAFVRGMSGEIEAARRHAEEGLQVAIAIDDRFAVGRAYFGLAVVHEFAGQHEQAARDYAESVRHFLAVGLTSWAGLAIGNQLDQEMLGGTAHDTGSLLETAFRLVEQGAYATGRAMVACQWGYAARASGDIDAAINWFHRSINEAEAIGAGRITLGAVAGLAAVAVDSGDLAGAIRLLGAVDSAKDEIGVVNIALVTHARLTEERARTAIGNEAFIQAWSEGRGLSWPATLASALEFAASVGGSAPVPVEDA